MPFYGKCKDLLNCSVGYFSGGVWCIIDFNPQRKIRLIKNNKDGLEIRLDELTMTLSNQDFMPILLGGEKQKTVWVALIQAKVSKLEGIISIDDEFTQITHTFTQFSVIP